MNFAEELEKTLGIKVCSVSGAEYSTFKIGGRLLNFITVDDEQQLQRLLAYLFKIQHPYKILGAGSNILFPDTDCQTPLIKLGKGFSTCQKVSEKEFQVGAAYNLILLASQMSKAGMSGLEFAGGIPATLGGALRMNAGAHGSQISDILDWVEITDREGAVRRILPEELNFRYRASDLPPGSIVTGLRIRLTPSDPQKTTEKWSSFLTERRNRQPLEYPSAGSIFKNPPLDKSAGRLLEEVGMKGETRGGAMFSTKHANWIVNPDRQATASDVLALIDLAKERVFSSFGVELETELQIWQA